VSANWDQSVKEDTPSVKVVNTLRAIEPRAWNALAVGQSRPSATNFSTRFMNGLCCETTGWSPHYLTLWQGASLVGACRSRKSHSYGEYVFGLAWADAYHRHGLS